MEAVTKSKVLQLFNKLTEPEKLDVFKQISQLTFKQRWDLLDAELPDIEMSEEEIMEEVRAVRYGKKD